jgi:uncharacterized membrane protein YgcG
LHLRKFDTPTPEADMTNTHLAFVAFGIALAIVVPHELWVMRQRRQPGWGMDRFIGLDGREWYYYRKSASGDGGGGGDSGSGDGCGGDGGGSCGGH